MLIREQLGGVLRDIRTAKHMTLGDVTRGARISTAHLSELERGLTEPSSEIIRTLADFYRVSQAELFLEVGARMATSEERFGSSSVDDLGAIFYGEAVPAGLGFDALEAETALYSMPDIHNVMPEAPDHLPESLVAEVTDSELHV